MNPRKGLKQLRQAAKTSRGKEIITFLIFLAVSTVFWFMMTLNETVQRDYRMTVEITDIPSGTSLITVPPTHLNVSVKDKGRALIKYDWGGEPKLTLRYNDFNLSADNRLVISKEQLSNNVRAAFGSGCEVIAVRPDSISLAVTERPGDKLPLIVDINARASSQYIIYGIYKCDFDSVTVYSQHGLPSNVLMLHTEPLSLRNLTDSTTVELAVKAPAGTRVVPSKVKVTIPVEPLVAKKRIVKIETRNVPRHTSLLVFPSTVEIDYLLPMSLYNTDNAIPKAFVDYNAIDANSSNLPVNIGYTPDYYRDAQISPSTVEFMMERKNVFASPAAAYDALIGSESKE